MRQFNDRADAGRQLASRMGFLRGQDVVILGLPRGGVPVAFEVAKALQAPLDVLLVRKLGVPYHPELAFGAIGEGGERVISDVVVRETRLSDQEMAAVETQEWAELQRRSERFRGAQQRIPLTGRIAVIVDDGIATGATAQAACQVARAEGASRVVLAVPIGATDTARQFAQYADEVVCLETPVPYFAVGQGYRNFAQTSDDEVMALLSRARSGFGSPPARRSALRDEKSGSPGRGLGGQASDRSRAPEGRRRIRARQWQQQTQPGAIDTSPRCSTTPGSPRCSSTC